MYMTVGVPCVRNVDGVRGICIPYVGGFIFCHNVGMPRSWIATNAAEGICLEVMKTGNKYGYYYADCEESARLFTLLELENV